MEVKNQTTFMITGQVWRSDWAVWCQSNLATLQISPVVSQKNWGSNLKCQDLICRERKTPHQFQSEIQIKCVVWSTSRCMLFKWPLLHNLGQASSKNIKHLPYPEKCVVWMIFRSNIHNSQPFAWSYLIQMNVVWMTSIALRPHPIA